MINKLLSLSISIAIFIINKITFIFKLVNKTKIKKLLSVDNYFCIGNENGKL